MSGPRIIGGRSTSARADDLDFNLDRIASVLGGGAAGHSGALTAVNFGTDRFVTLDRKSEPRSVFAVTIPFSPLMLWHTGVAGTWLGGASLLAEDDLVIVGASLVYDRIVGAGSQADILCKIEAFGETIHDSTIAGVTPQSVRSVGGPWTPSVTMPVEPGKDHIGARLKVSAIPGGDAQTSGIVGARVILSLKSNHRR